MYVYCIISFLVSAVSKVTEWRESLRKVHVPVSINQKSYKIIFNFSMSVIIWGFFYLSQSDIDNIEETIGYKNNGFMKSFVST